MSNQFNPEQDRNESIKLKSYIVLFFATLLILVVLARLIFIQVINRSYYVNYSKKQFIRTAKIYPNRGLIYDRNGNPLALNVQRFNIFITPRGIKDLGTTTYELGKIIKGVNYRKLYKNVKRRNKFTWVKRDIELSDSDVEKIEKLDGVNVERVWGRFYPDKNLASQAIGFVNIDNKGISGLELKYDKELKGREKTISYIRDAKGRALKFEAETGSLAPKDLTLSIDKEIQRVAQKYLREGVEKHQALAGGIGVMDANTGEIWAIANYPSFDSNNPSSSEVKHRKLSFISNPFEPGSVSKAHTVATALEDGKVSLASVYDCENGSMRIGPDRIRESNGHQYKLLSVEEILSLSSNIGTSKIAFDLGEEKIIEGFKSFGYGEKTGLELPSESKGIFNFEKGMKKIKLSNVSFGQGVAATGIQMLKSFAPFANGGYLARPTLIKVDEKSSEHRIKLLEGETVTSMQKAMIKVIESGTGSRAQIKNFKIAGKTGTAQKSSGNSKGYAKDEYIASFAGFPVGADKPFVIFVYVDTPTKNGFYGNEVAAPIFKKVAESILIKNNELKSLAFSSKINNDKVQFKQASVKRVLSEKIPNFLGLDSSAAQSLAKKIDVEVEIIGRGVVVKQFPKEFTASLKDKKVILKLEIPRYE